MRKILFICCLIVMVGCKSKKNGTSAPEALKTSKIETTEISSVQKNKAYDLGKRVLMTCNTSKFKPFNTSEATPSVIQNTTQDKLTKTCLKFRLKYGDFKDLQLVEVYQNKADQSNIYRFKALYEKKIANKELRVTMTEDNLVSSIKSLDWVDKF